MLIMIFLSFYIDMLYIMSEYMAYGDSLGVSWDAHLRLVWQKIDLTLLARANTLDLV